MGKRAKSDAGERAEPSAAGELPGGWCWARLDNVAEVRLGRQRSPDKMLGLSPRPYLRAANVTWTGLDLRDVNSMDFTAEEAAIYELKSGDVLLNEASGSPAEVGKAALYRGEIEGCCFQNTLIRVRPGVALDSEYLASRLRFEALRGAFVDHGRGIGINHLGSAKMQSWPIPLPPLAEQRRIVAKLEALLGRIRRAREALDAVPAMVERYKKSVLGAAFAHIDAPRELLGAVCSAITSGSRGWAEHYASEGAIFVRVGNFRRNEVDLDLTSVTYVDPPRDAEGTRTGLTAGDVLITITADVGKTAVVRDSLGEAYVNQHVALCRPFAKVDSEYLAWCLLDPGGIQHTIRDLEYGMTKASLSLRQLRELQIPLPPLDEQRAIVARIDAAFARARAMLSAADAARAQLDVLERSVLAKAFRGELVEQDPADEPASVMLDRVRADRAKSGAPAKKPRKPRASTELAAPTIVPEPVAPSKPAGTAAALVPVAEWVVRVAHAGREGLPVHDVRTTHGGASADEFYRELRAQIDAGRLREERRGEQAWIVANES